MPEASHVPHIDQTFPRPGAATSSGNVLFICLLTVLTASQGVDHRWPASRLPWQGSLKMQILLHTSLFSSHVLDPSPVRFVTDNSESYVETVTCRLIKTMTSDLCINMHVPAMVVSQPVASVTSARVDEHRNCSTSLQVGYRPRCEFQPPRPQDGTGQHTTDEEKRWRVWSVMGRREPLWLPRLVTARAMLVAPLSRLFCLSSSPPPSHLPPILLPDGHMAGCVTSAVPHAPLRFLITDSWHIKQNSEQQTHSCTQTPHALRRATFSFLLSFLDGRLHGGSVVRRFSSKGRWFAC